MSPRFSISTLVALLSLTLPVSHAIEGITVREGGPESTCKIQTKSQEGAAKGLCSGTLIGSTEVATAAHCFDHLQPTDTVRVSCGFDWAPIENLSINGLPTGKTSDEVLFKENHEVQSIRVNEAWDPSKKSNLYDTAVVTLRTSSALTIPNLPTEALRDAAKKVNYCRISGFGLGPGSFVGYLYSNTFRAARLDMHHRDDGRITFTLAQEFKTEAEPDIQYLSSLKASSLSGRGPTETGSMEIWKRVVAISKINGNAGPMAMLGDSGGPLFCRSVQETEWTYFGIISQVGWGIKPPPAGDATFKYVISTSLTSWVPTDSFKVIR